MTCTIMQLFAASEDGSCTVHWVCPFRGVIINNRMCIESFMKLAAEREATGEG